MDQASHSSTDDESSSEIGYDSNCDVNHDNAIMPEDDATNTISDVSTSSGPLEAMNTCAKVMDRHDQLQSKIEDILLCGFNTIKDPSHETAILFVCGIFAGGVVNAYIAAFGLFYGLSILQPAHFEIIKASIAVVLFVDSLSSGGFGVIVGTQIKRQLELP